MTIGEVEIDPSMTLAQVRSLILTDLEVDFKDFTFLLNHAPMMKVRRYCEVASFHKYFALTVRGG